MPLQSLWPPQLLQRAMPDLVLHSFGYHVIPASRTGTGGSSLVDIIQAHSLTQALNILGQGTALLQQRVNIHTRPGGAVPLIECAQNLSSHVPDRPQQHKLFLQRHRI